MHLFSAPMRCREEADTLKQGYESAAYAADQAGNEVQLAERKLRSCFPQIAAVHSNTTGSRNSSAVMVKGAALYRHLKENDYQRFYQDFKALALESWEVRYRQIWESGCSVVYL